MEFLRGALDLAYAAKAWLGTLVAAIAEVVLLVQTAIADEAISFEEAEGIWMAVVAVVGVVVTFLTIFSTRNKPTPT